MIPDQGAERPVDVVAHLPYYVHTAVALHRAGLLHRFVSAPMSPHPSPLARVPGLGGLGGYYNRTRVDPRLAGVPMRRMWAAQTVALTAQRLAMRTGRGTALALRSALWDRAGRLHLRGPSRPESWIVHGLSGIMAGTAAWARRRGALVVCDVRAAHPRAMHRHVTEVLRRRGVRYEPPDAGIVGRMEREFGLSDVLVCNSEYTRRSFLAEGFDPARVVAVPLGCDVERFRPADRRPEQFTVLFVGRDSYRKGLLDLLEAARALPRGTRLLVAGEIDSTSRGVLVGLGIEVEVLGGVGADEMAVLYHRASVLALPSLSEAFGMVVLEAMASGVPVVISDQVGAGDVVTDGVDGFVVPVGDTEALAERLLALSRDRVLVEAMSRHARRAAEGNTWDHYGERLVQAYREVVLPLTR
ncbi:glycosyltransferase family 4 protein [Rhabdothermincola sp.]|uniref:glycosyltransferase family 4 protein n=1 Tax=Rhabdothermincola sp. TaxID=2820405 RepID=UPI002FE3D49C